MNENDFLISEHAEQQQQSNHKSMKKKIQIFWLGYSFLFFFVRNFFFHNTRGDASIQVQDSVFFFTALIK